MHHQQGIWTKCCLKVYPLYTSSSSPFSSSLSATATLHSHSNNSSHQSLPPDPHMIPTSLDLACQKDNEIHIPSPTIVSHIPYVRNTSPNLPTNYSSPRTNSLNHITINSFTLTSNLIDHLPKHFQSKPIHTSMPISTLQIANDHQLVPNFTIINTISVIDSKRSTKKSSAFPRKKIIFSYSPTYC